MGYVSRGAEEAWNAIHGWLVPVLPQYQPELLPGFSEKGLKLRRIGLNRHGPRPKSREFAPTNERKITETGTRYVDYLISGLLGPQDNGARRVVAFRRRIAPVRSQAKGRSLGRVFRC
jgi:hypothetical protein